MHGGIGSTTNNKQDGQECLSRRKWHIGDGMVIDGLLRVVIDDSMFN